MKQLIRIEADRIQVYNLKKGQRQMVSIGKRLYRVDDSLMVKDVRTDTATVFYGLDDVQPIGCRAKYVDSDMTRAYIDSAKISGNKVSIWSSWNTDKIMGVLTAVIVIGALAWGIVSGAIA